MKTSLRLILGFMVLFYGFGHAQEFAKVGTAGAQFLKIGVGARGVAMAEAYDAVCDDVTAVFWNPAGLVHIKNNSFMAAHANWIADIKYEAAAYAKTFPRIGTFGLSFSYLSSGDIEETTVLQQEGTGRFFDTANLMFGVSYARMLTDRFSVGGNIKYIEERLDTEKARAWAIDIGTLYRTGFKSLRMGMSIRNFGPELKFTGTYQDYDNGEWVIDSRTQQPEQREFLPYHMPMTFKISLAYDLLDSENQNMTLAMDLVHPNDNVERLNVGAEFVWLKMFALRAGYIGPFGLLGRYGDEVENKNATDEKSYDVENYAANFSAGVGFNMDMKGFGLISIDYAYTDFGVLDWAHRASLAVNF
ncbi:PorV/PorQ family protein [candidate division KSB1 bacterium]|nr:PorV/PorQ family protein [candidate division KSB1 bacterium]